MRRTVIKSVIIAAVFAIALLVLSKIMNQGNTDMTVEMSEASYPVVSMHVEGYDINRLHGYATAMNTAYLRDSLLPVGSDRTVSVAVDTYQTEISALSFEVRSLDGSRLVENTDITDYERDGDVLNFQFTL